MQLYGYHFVRDDGSFVSFSLVCFTSVIFFDLKKKNWGGSLSCEEVIYIYIYL